jgi:hypothetical protein
MLDPLHGATITNASQVWLKEGVRFVGPSAARLHRSFLKISFSYHLSLRRTGMTSWKYGGSHPAHVYQT